MSEKLTIIDADGLIFYCAYGFKDQLNMIGTSAAKERIDDYILRILNVTKASHYLGFYGEEGKKNFRHGWATVKPYKGTRKPEAWQTYFKPRLKKHFLEKWGFIPVGDMEADDAVIIAHHQFKDEWDITHVGEDKDMKQVGEFKRYNPKKREFENVSHWEGRKFFWSQMIMGDSSDNINGIHGQGKKSPYIGALLEVEDPTEDKLFEIVRDAYIHKYADEYLYHMTENYILLNMLTKVNSMDYPKNLNPVVWNAVEKFSPELLNDL
tara:strand:+ start:2108 stop:2905 length:798 start_codon:yes stop_codon:yes gene_type:complete